MSDDRRLSIIPAPIARDLALSDAARCVALIIGLHMNSDGKCWPGNDLLAAERGCSVRSIERAIAELCA